MLERPCRRRWHSAIAVSLCLQIFTWVLLCVDRSPTSWVGGYQHHHGVARGHTLLNSFLHQQLRCNKQATCRHVISDDTVPEEHANLHNTLYGAGSSGEVHAQGQSTARWPGRLDGSEMLEVNTWLEQIDAFSSQGDSLSLAIGLYALYDNPAATPIYIGYSRQVHVDIARYAAKYHQSSHPLFVRVNLLGSQHRMWSRALLEEERTSWAKSLGFDASSALMPHATPGTHDVDAFMPAAKRAFEERKWKLQLAMGESLADSSDGNTPDAIERREMFMHAVEGDDWSAVVNGQTQGTVTSSTQGFTSSPFAMRSPAGTPSADNIPKDLTVQNVNLVLQSLRPILVADGGDIEVIGVDAERGAVILGLLGACTTCPAAPSTMENGIEKSLRDHFGSSVREVVRVDAGADAATDNGIRRRIELHLDSLEDALTADGASAILLPSSRQSSATEDPDFHVEFRGPPMLFQLVQSSLKHQFPEVSGRLQVLQSTSA